MNLLATAKLVISTLLARKGRSFLTVLGIVIGVAGVIIIIALGAGAQSLVLSQISTLGANLVGILPGKSDETGPPAFVFGVEVTTLTEEDALALSDRSRMPHVSALSAYVRGTATVVWRDENVDTNFTGVWSTYPAVQSATVESGRFFDEREQSGGANVIVLGSEVKRLLFGDAGALGEVVKIKGVPFEVIGVMESIGSVAFENQDDMVLIPFVVAQRQILGINHAHFIRAKVDAAENVDPTIQDMELLLRERHGVKNPEEDDFSVRNAAEAIELLTTITNGLRLFLTAMAGIALIVGGIGIMNIMLVTVAERTREIGLRKALGATRENVRNQFLFESSFITLLGGLIGIVGGAVISFLIALLARSFGYEWAYVISPISIALAVGVSVLTGVIFGLYPAFKAAKLNPIDALRYE